MSKEIKILLGGIWFGVQVGMSIQSWLTRRNEEYPRLQRENKKLAGSLPVKKVNEILKAIKAEEKAKDTSLEWKRSKECCTSIQDDLDSSGINYNIPTYLRQQKQEANNA